MTRLIGPDEACREVKTIVASAGVTKGLFKSKALKTATYYTDPDQTATPTVDMLTELADILDLDDAAITDSTVTIDAYSMLPLMQFPDGADSLLVVVDSGPPWRVYPRSDDQFDALETRMSAAEADGADNAAAVTAEATARAAADTTLSGLITTEASSRASGDTAAIATAAADATTKANAAQAAAIAAAATDATTKVAAEATTRASADTAAIATAATDATTKANAAQAAAVQRANHTGVQAISTVTSLQTTLDAKVAKGDIVIRMADYADNTGATFADTGITNAQTAAGATGTIDWTAGTYKTASTTTITCNSTASPDAIISYTGTGVAVLLGTGGSGSGSLISRKKFEVPQISYANKPATGWDAGTVGLKVQNVFTAEVRFPRIVGFEIGHLVYGLGYGVSYVKTYVGHLDNNKINQQLDKDATGWANQNSFYGGRWSHNSNEGLIVSGTKHIYTKHSAGNADPNNNTWYTPSLESPGVVEYVLDIAGAYNKWDNPRFEYTPGTPNIYWRATAFRNRVFGGFDVDRLQENFDSGQFGNWIDGTDRAYWRPSSTRGIVVENQGSSSYPQFTGMRAGGIAAGDDPVTQYQYQLTANGLRGQRYNDANPRVDIDFSNGTVKAGDGTATPVALTRTADVQTFTSSGTWTKPTGAKTVQVTLIAGGGGGGSGRKGLDGTVRCGGGGGAGGAHTIITIPAASLGSSIAVTVGTGGAGGASQSTASTNGSTGTTGGATTFAGFVRASGGVGGGGGTATTGAAGSSPTGTSPGGAGAAASTTGGVPTGPPSGGGSIGGCAGGGITSGNSASNGGSSNSTGTTWGVVSGGAAGVVDTSTPNNGGAAPASTPIPGAAGGGGAASITTNAQAGANGGLYGTGGSGGGASKDAVGDSGAGGNGADGIAQIITYF